MYILTQTNLIHDGQFASPPHHSHHWPGHTDHLSLDTSQREQTKVSFVSDYGYPGVPYCDRQNTFLWRETECPFFVGIPGTEVSALQLTVIMKMYGHIYSNEMTKYINKDKYKLNIQQMCLLHTIKCKRNMAVLMTN